MRTYYPMATYDGKTDPLHTLTTYDSLMSPKECLTVIKNWISMGYKPDKCWIQEYTDGNLSAEVEVKVNQDGELVIVLL